MFIIQERLCCRAIPSRETLVLLEMMGAYFRCGGTQLSNGLDNRHISAIFFGGIMYFGQVLLRDSPYYITPSSKKYFKACVTKV